MDAREQQRRLGRQRGAVGQHDAVGLLVIQRHEILDERLIGIIGSYSNLALLSCIAIDQRDGLDRALVHAKERHCCCCCCERDEEANQMEWLPL